MSAAARAASADAVDVVDVQDGAADLVSARLRPGDLVVTMGAGDIDLVARELARRRSGDKENRC